MRMNNKKPFKLNSIEFKIRDKKGERGKGVKKHLYKYHKNQIQCYTAVFHGVLLRISPPTFLQLKIQLETARFEPRTFRVPV